MVEYPVKITVLRCLQPSEVFCEVPLNTSNNIPHVACPVFDEGQVFIANSIGTPPEGFCPNAWQDIVGYVRVLHHGGSFYPWLSENEMIRCCTDGLRPVVFRLERVNGMKKGFE